MRSVARAAWPYLYIIVMLGIATSVLWLPTVGVFPGDNSQCESDYMGSCN